jgi:DNA-binding MarR family transcriptional regulator
MLLGNTSDEHLQALAEAAEAYVQHSFGQRLNLKPSTPSSLPHFVLDRYKLWQGTLNGRSVALMAVREPRQGATSDYLKHRDLVRQRLGADLSLLLIDQVPNAIRRQMIERKIGFLAPGTQLYIPEALLDIRERTPFISSAPTDHISPTTQMVLLAALQGRALVGSKMTEIAARLKVSPMSMSRTLDELEALQLAKPHCIGRQRHLNLSVTGRELWDSVRDQLQSPVRKTRMVSGRIDVLDAPLAGESALARYTMLAAPRRQCRAVLSLRWKALEKAHSLKSATIFDDDQIEIQTWTYDPTILAKNGVIDRLSLYLAVRKSPDERVAQASEELLETMEW